MAVKPPALPEQATIAVVAPASPPQTRSEIEQATAYFESRGHEVVFGPNHRKVHGYLAGTDEERAADLQWALSEPGIDMVHALEGGYGTARLHPPDRLGARSATRGSSAASATSPRCTCSSPRHAGWVSFYGPSFLRFTRTKGDYELTEETEEWFHRALRPEPLGKVFEDPEDPYVLTARRGRRRGAAGRRLPDPALLEHRHPLRGRDRRLHPDGRGPQHRGLPGRHGAQPPAPRRQARRRRRLRVRDQRQPRATRRFPRGPSRRSRSRRSSTS